MTHNQLDTFLFTSLNCHRLSPNWTSLSPSCISGMTRRFPSYLEQPRGLGPRQSFNLTHVVVVVNVNVFAFVSGHAF